MRIESSFRRRVAQATLLLLFTAGCATSADVRQRAVTPGGRAVSPTVDELQRRTFQWFWDTTNPKNGLVPDRWPTKSFSSVAAVGFGLTVYPVGVERGWVTREAARERVLTTLRFLWNAPQGDAPAGVTGYRGFFYHFLDMESGHRFETVELSTIDTALLMAGALFCQSYFDRDDAGELEIRELAENLYRRIEWPWFQKHSPAITMAWRPEEGFGSWEYRGYDEAMILYILALGSPAHPIGPEAWTEFTRTYNWGPFYGYEHVNFAPLFGHQYSHVWIDFRGIRDAYMREKGIDYFENSRRATLAQRAYAIDNPGEFAGYGPNIWGLTACDGPLDMTLQIDGRAVTFHTYHARGAARGEIRDDGTIAPTAAAGSIAFTPGESAAAIEEMVRRFGDHLYQQYGFLDAFNETLQRTDVPLQHGRVVPGVGWFDSDYLGIDQGPILTMIENQRSGLVWEVMKRNPHVVRGLKRAGFTGGWLEGR
ncbi:MAG TPA: glucoamylase family protein [Thermoanaerobaculia bacterium]|nr:glucoamylase family protein [Thermoanaerobaculia bacterium]